MDYYSILKAVVVSGGLLLKNFHGRVENRTKTSDLPDNMVQASSIAHTELDDLVQEIALEILHNFYPQVSINAEENTPRVKQFDVDKKGLCFHLDPLDGTHTYVNNRDDYAIGAGFSRNKTFVASAVYLPEKDLLFFGQRGNGIKITTGEGKPVQTIRPEKPQPTYNQKRCEEFQSAIDRMGYTPFDSMSAHNSMMAIVQGDCAFILYKAASPHDFGIPQIILEEVGGVCTTETGGKVHYSDDFARVPYFFAFFDETVKTKFFEGIGSFGI